MAVFMSMVGELGPAILLFLAVTLGYVCTWKHNLILMSMCGLFALVAILIGGLDLTMLMNPPDDATGLDRFMALGPSIMLFCSISIGYVYAWKHKGFHTAICLMIAASSLIMGW